MQESNLQLENIKTEIKDITLSSLYVNMNLVVQNKRNVKSVIKSKMLLKYEFILFFSKYLILNEI